MKHLFGKVLLSCGLALVMGSYGFGDSANVEIQTECTRKINKAKFFSSLAAVLDKISQATVSSPKTKEEDQSQKIEAVAAVLDFVSVVSGQQEEPAKDQKDAKETKKQVRSCDMIISSELLESVFAALRLSLEANIADAQALVRSSFDTAKTVQNNVFLTRGVVDSTVTVQNTATDTSKLVVTLITVVWKLVQEALTQENISDYLSKQVTQMINYVYGHLVLDITQGAQQVIDQTPTSPIVQAQGALVGNIVAGLISAKS